MAETIVADDLGVWERRRTAEQATGCVQRGDLRLYLDDGKGETILSPEDALGALEASRCVAVPAAGAGSYEALAAMLGLGRVTLWESSSSAGDWMIRLDERPGEFLVQHNRYPYHGFRYRLAADPGGWRKGVGQ